MSNEPQRALKSVTVRASEVNEAEQSVLGAFCIAGNEAFEKASAIGLRYKHFSNQHAPIYKCCERLLESNQAIDLTTIADHLAATGDIGRVGGLKYLADIANGTPSTARVDAYALAVIASWRIREVARITNEPLSAHEKLAQLRLLINDENIFGPSFCEVDVNGLLQVEIPEQHFIINPVLPRNVVTLLGGHGGIGKSQCALALCAHVAAGESWAGLAVTQGKVIFCSLEDDGNMVKRRLRNTVRAYQLDAKAVSDNLRIIDGTEGDAALMVESADYPQHVKPTAAFKKLGVLSSGVDLIVIDNASDAFLGNENSRRDVRAFMRALTQLARANNAAVVLLAHIDKNAARNGGSGNSYSGSTAWHNSARSRLALIEENGAIELRHEKSNVSKRADSLRLAFGPHGVLMPADRVQDFSQVAEDVRARTDADAILRIVEVAIKADITVTTATSGPVTSWHCLEPLPELGPIFRDKEGKRRVHAALLRLVREGRLAKATYQKSNRHPGERYELAQNAPMDA